MIKRFWSYQVLLGASAGFANAKEHRKLPFFMFFIYMLYAITLGVMLREAGIIFFPLVLILFPTYFIITSQNKLFETVPVSKLYSLINIYLYSLVMILSLIGTFVIMALSFKILKLFIHNFTCADFVINSLVNNWKAILITGFIYAIIVNILVPVFFINLNFLRKALTISIVALIIIALRLFKNTLPVVTELGKTNFLDSIAMMSHYKEFLLILVCGCAVIIPISMFISYRLYKGKRCLVC
jgi:hypothetical protein